MSANLAHPLFPRFMESGPLVLDCMKDRAFMEAEHLELTDEQFESLYLLVQREGEYMAFETLYNSVWEPLDYTDCRQAALRGMDELVKTVNTAGNGYVHIEAAAEGYRYLFGSIHNS
jgi:DNA-binding response OmpR family regulator